MMMMMMMKSRQDDDDCGVIDWILQLLPLLMIVGAVVTVGIL
jgi:hypothetical protein